MADGIYHAGKYLLDAGVLVLLGLKHLDAADHLANFALAHPDGHRAVGVEFGALTAFFVAVMVIGRAVLAQRVWAALKVSAKARDCSAVGAVCTGVSLVEGAAVESPPPQPVIWLARINTAHMWIQVFIAAVPSTPKMMDLLDQVVTF